MHCQNADWAIPFLLHKFNITARDSLVGTDFRKYVKYKRPESRGGKPFLSGKSWKTTHDPWRGLSRTSFGIDYLKYYSCPEGAENQGDFKEKMMELNHYDKDENPCYGWDIYVQRLSCYVQHKETVQEMSQYQDIENPYGEAKNENNIHRYVPDLHSLDNGNTIIIFENSQSGSIEDTIITARQQWESKWRRLPFYLAYESRDISNDDRMALECMKIVLQDVWNSVAENWESFLDVSNTHVSILEDKICTEPFLPDSHCAWSRKTCRRSPKLLGHVSRLRFDPTRNLLTPKSYRRVCTFRVHIAFLSRYRVLRHVFGPSPSEYVLRLSIPAQIGNTDGETVI